MMQHVLRGAVLSGRARGHVRSVLRPSSGTAAAAADSSLVDAHNAPSDFETRCAVVYPNFMDEQEHDQINDLLQARMKRSRYQKGHWDAVIIDYKEVELIDEHFADDPTSIIHEITKRARDHLHHHHFPQTTSVTWLPCHAIDLKKDGKLQKHVDSIKFSGGIVAGLSLLSPSIMRLVPDETQLLSTEESIEDAGYVDLFLPPRSLYALTGVARYRYTHELLPSGSTFGPKKVDRDRRISIIFRDAKEQEE